MPNKERLKSSQERKRPKPQYKVTNWSAYNRSLADRGRISLLFPKGDIRTSLINDQDYQPGVSGRQVQFHDGYIELLFMLYRLYRLPLRQLTGFIHNLWQLQGLTIPVPSFGHLSDRFARLSMKIRVQTAKTLKQLRDGLPVDLIIDSSGLKLDQAGEWLPNKHGDGTHRRNWAKLHIGQTPDGDILVGSLTDSTISDPAILEQFLQEDLSLNKLIADGAYYQIERNEQLMAKHVTPVIPPPSNAVAHDTPETRLHDEMVRYRNEKGVYAFQKKYGYGVRAKVEAQFSRLKRCLGESLHTHRTDSRKNEAVVLINLLNLWNSFGRAEYIITA